jgi:glycosyltransferase involved in cell wall biosynthesis
MPSTLIEASPVLPQSKGEKQTLRVAAFTGGEGVPSRIRVRQYIAPLKTAGVEITEFASRAGMYPPDTKWARPAWGIWNLAEHIPSIIRSRTFDVTLLQREMLSTLVTLEPFTRRPRVFDVDDAIWLHRRGNFAGRLARLSDHIVCGNQFLADKFSTWNPSVSVLPTAVDTGRFRPTASISSSARPVIGWLGLSSGFQFLCGIKDALSQILARHPNLTLRIVSDRPPPFRAISSDRVEFIRYDAAKEVEHIQQMTVGIMPIEDSEWSRGKCSYKMLLYMACGIPVVVSPFGMNAEILAQGNVGLGARTTANWVESFEILVENSDLRELMGREGRRVVLDHYSVDVLAPRLAQTLASVEAS